MGTVFLPRGLPFNTREPNSLHLISSPKLKCRQMRFSPLAVDSEDGDAVVEQEVLAAAVNKAANIIRNLDKLIPYDASDVNMGLVVW